jgi:hypothetical protein
MADIADVHHCVQMHAAACIGPTGEASVGEMRGLPPIGERRPA